MRPALEMLDVMDLALFRTIELDAQLIDLYACRHDPINIEEIRELILERDVTNRLSSHYVSRELLERVLKDRKDYLFDEIARVVVVIMCCSSVTEIPQMFRAYYMFNNQEYFESVLTNLLLRSLRYLRSSESEAILRGSRSDDGSNSDSDSEDEEFVGSANSMLVLVESSHGSLN